MPLISLYSPQTPYELEELLENRLQIHDATYVAQTMIPDFSPMPQVVLYGERHFIRLSDTTKYLECFTYVVPIRSTNQKKLGETMFGKTMKERYNV